MVNQSLKFRVSITSASRPLSRALARTSLADPYGSIVKTADILHGTLGQEVTSNAQQFPMRGDRRQVQEKAPFPEIPPWPARSASCAVQPDKRNSSVEPLSLCKKACCKFRELSAPEVYFICTWEMVKCERSLNMMDSMNDLGCY